MTTGRVFDLQRFSVHDGPGIRTTVFLKGCPLRCRWCQNPEGLERAISLWHFENLCGRSGRCQEVCPTNAITLTPTGVEINHAACTLCGDCVDACPRNALAFDGRDITTDGGRGRGRPRRDLPRGLRRRRDLLGRRAAGPGRVRARDGRRAQGAGPAAPTLESSFHAPWASIEPLLPVIDLFIVDVKVADSDAHRVATGVTNELILANLTATRGGAPRDRADPRARAARPAATRRRVENLGAIADLVAEHRSRRCRSSS